MRRLIVSLAVLAGLFVAADRGAEVLAARAVAVHAQHVEHLAAPPSVTIRGFPFLTQAFAGRYTEVDVTAHGLVRGGLRFRDVQARLYGVQVPLAALIHRAVRRVPVAHATGSAFLSYADLETLPAAQLLHLALSTGGPSDVRVTGSVHLFGASLQLGADAAVSVAGGTLAITPLPATVQALRGLLPAALRDRAAADLALHVPLSALPFGIRLTGVSAAPGGLEFAATSSGLDLRAG